MELLFHKYGIFVSSKWNKTIDEAVFIWRITDKV